MYARSGNQQKMAAARAQFPSVTELLRVKVGKKAKAKAFRAGVGETVVLKTLR
jgi:hypothetical protein